MITAALRQPRVDDVVYSHVRYDALTRIHEDGDVFLWRHNWTQDSWRAVVERLGDAPSERAVNYPRGYELLGVAEGRAIMFLFRAGAIGALLTGQFNLRPVCRALVTDAGRALLETWNAPEFAPAE